MRNDVHFPPPPGETPRPSHVSPAATSAPAGPSPVAAVGGHGGAHPHSHNDRAHSLNRTSDATTTGPIYETPEDRGGIDSLTLSIVVVAAVAIGLLVIAFLFFRRLG